jgi:hypothetical protein
MLINDIIVDIVIRGMDEAQMKCLYQEPNTETFDKKSDSTDLKLMKNIAIRWVSCFRQNIQKLDFYKQILLNIYEGKNKRFTFS